MNGIFMDFITVNGKRLYFQKYEARETMQTFKEQFSKLNNGEELPLTVGNSTIDPNMPIMDLVTTQEEIKTLGKVINKMVKKEEIEEHHFEEIEQPTIEKLIRKVEAHNIEAAF
jgi:hypothetical protein